MYRFDKAICITLGEQSENHVGMKIQGNGLSQSGFSIQDLKHFQLKFKQLEEVIEPGEIESFETELIELHKVESKIDNLPEAAVLVLRNGVNIIGELYASASEIYDELIDLDWDKKYYDVRRQQVLNKHARYNLCFGEDSVEPDYINKQGRIISVEEVCELNQWITSVEKFTDEKELEAEGNLYYNKNKCGISFHGDSERKKVIAANFGYTREIHWIWYYKSERISSPIKVTLHHGDMYIMSEKASGWDWKKRNIATLRHAAGAKKYLK